jgi:prophage maintenance system killer protein/ribosomal protein S15P/S13E
MKNAPEAFFDVDTIHANYRMVQADFGRINSIISCQRDAFDDSVVRNLMLAINYLNAHLKTAAKDHLLTPRNMLELNAIVHLGLSRDARKEYKGFLRQTEDKFQKYFPDLITWYRRHERENDDPYKIAAGLYVRILAAPQLFFDGNHRTGALIANYYLMTKGHQPFVVTTENAVEFFNLASDIKFKKKDIRSKFKRAVGWRDEVQAMRDFLIGNAQPFITPTLKEWHDETPEEPVQYVVTDSVRRLGQSMQEEGVQEPALPGPF